MSKYTIIGRTSPACKYCEKAKELLDAKGIEYEFIDLTGNDTAINVFKALGYSTVPIIIDQFGSSLGGYETLKLHLKDVHPLKRS